MDIFRIYTTSAFECKWCIKLKELLNVYGYDFVEHDIATDERAKQDFVEHGFRTVPQVFLDQKCSEPKHIGGYETTKDYLRNNFFKDHPDYKEIKQQLMELE